MSSGARDAKRRRESPGFRFFPSDPVVPARPEPEGDRAAAECLSPPAVVATPEAVEVRTFSSGAGSNDDAVVTSYRVFSDFSDWKHAWDLSGRYEKVRTGSAFPEWVEARFPAELLRKGHRMVTTITADEPYSVVRRVRGEKTEYVKYFSCAAEGHREAKVQEYMHARYPDHVVPVVESGTVCARRGAGKSLPPPCLGTDCPDVEFYLVTADVGDGYVPGSHKTVVDREGVRDYVSSLLGLLHEMRVASGFTHWDLHGNNFFYNPETRSFRFLDFGFATVDVPSSHPTAKSGTCLADNPIVVPESVLEDFDGEKRIFGFYYDVGRVMLHSSAIVREEVLRIHGADKPEFLEGYENIIRARRRRPRSRHVHLPVVLELDHYYVARFALEACMDFDWIPKRSDVVARGVGPPTRTRRPIPRLLRPVPDREDTDRFREEEEPRKLAASQKR